VGVIENPNVSEVPKASFSINLAVFWASGLARLQGGRGEGDTMTSAIFLQAGLFI